MVIIFILNLLMIKASYAGLIQFDVVGSDKKIFSPREVCEKLSAKESVLSNIISMTKIDCMGKIFEVDQFCDEKFKKSEKYLRAYTDKENKTVICESASKVILKYECESKDDSNCLDSEIGCFEFKKKLVKNLKVIHHSIIDSQKDPKSISKKTLNCYFDYKI